MDIGETLNCVDRQEWRKWLHEHHDNTSEIWLILYKKAANKKSIQYAEAVEEALCYGWIDSLMKGIDGEQRAQRFSPRKSTSVLSQLNLERIRDLIKQKKMTQAGLAALAHVYNPDTDQTLI